MMVLATNRPDDLDSAVVDRVDEAMHFDLPTPELRKHLLKLYFDTYITKAGEDASFFRRSAAKITVDGEGFTEEFWDDLAEKTEGFSGRGISKLMLAVQVRASGDGSCVV